MIARRDILAMGAGGMAAFAAAPGMVHAANGTARMLEYRDIRAAGLPDQRLSIWLPPGYADTDRSYRVLYMHDGHNLFDPALSNFNKVWAADRAMLEYSAGTGNDPWIIVGIWAPGNDRARQYLPLPAYNLADEDLRAQMNEFAQGPIISARYLDWIVTVLKPWVDGHLRTKIAARDTAIAGSSMGGLISLYAFLSFPEVFGRAACVSTHWPAVDPVRVEGTEHRLLTIWEAMLASGLGLPGTRKLWFDHGTATLDSYYAPYQEAIDRRMEASGWIRGTNWESMVYPGAEHEENAWAARLPEIFGWLLS